MKIKKAIILAGGLGTRLKTLTANVPKPMLEFKNKPVLYHQIALLKKYNIKDIVINLHYKPEIIEKYFKDGESFGVKITYLREKELSGTAGPLKKLDHYFKEPFLLFYGDNLIAMDLAKLIDYHFYKRGLATLTVCKVGRIHRGFVELDKENRVISFEENKELKYATPSPYVFSPEIIDYIPKNKTYNLGTDLFPKLASQNFPIFGYKTEEFILDIGTPEDYNIGQNIWK